MIAGPSPPEDAASQDRVRKSAHSFPWLPALLLLAAFPLCFLGYGADNDSYGVIESGVSTWHLHLLKTSRNPGYWTYEALIYPLAAHGGYLLTNLASFLIAILVAWRFWKLAIRLRAPHPALLTACLIVTPGFLIAATSTDDYLWSLLCLVLGAEALPAERLLAATLLSGLALALRAGNGPVVAGGFAAAIALEVHRSRRVTPHAVKLAAVGLAAALLAAITLYPSYLLAGRSMRFTQAMDGPAALWTPMLRLGKFVYKGSVAIGPLALLVLLVAAILCMRRRRADMERHRTGNQPAPSVAADPLVVLSLGYLAGNLILFFRYPIEFYYLIPATFFALLLGGITLFRDSRPLTVALLVSILSFDFVWPVFLRPNVPGRSTSAYMHFGLDPGILLLDTRTRIRFMGCHTSKCVEDRSR